VTVVSAGPLQGNWQGFTVRTRRYDAVAKLGIQGARAHLAAAFPDGLALDAAFVAPALVAQVGRRAQRGPTRALPGYPVPAWHHVGSTPSKPTFDALCPHAGVERVKMLFMCALKRRVQALQSCRLRP